MRRWKLLCLSGGGGKVPKVILMSVSSILDSPLSVAGMHDTVLDSNTGPLATIQKRPGPGESVGQPQIFTYDWMHWVDSRSIVSQHSN